MRRLVPGLFLASVVLVLAACGGATAAPSSPTASDAASPATEAPVASMPADDGVPEPGTDLNACEIVTPDDIAAATGTEAPPDGTVEETPTSLSPGQTECEYDGEFGRLIVELTPEDGANLYDAARGSYDDASDVSNHGGDGAFYSTGNNRAFFWKGNVTVMLTFFLADGEDRAAIEEIGRLALAKV